MSCMGGMQNEVLIAGFGCKGHAVGDIHGVRFKVVKVSGVSSSLLQGETKVMNTCPKCFFVFLELLISPNPLTLLHLSFLCTAVK